MFLSPKKKTIVGLDIGSNTVRAIQLDLKDNEISLHACHDLNLSDHGIINDDEYCHTIRVWLEENNWKNIGICTALPQYLATVNVRDFPETGDADHLMQSMIDYETQHLSGISEENFINDYHVMPPTSTKGNPVLIGICKESVIDEKISIINNIGLNLKDISIDSIAVINALFSLHPEIKHEALPQMILDIGEDSSTGIIVAQGQVLYISSLMGNTEDIEKELSMLEHEEKQPEIEEDKLQVIRNADEVNSQSLHDSLSNELDNFLKQWKNLEKEDLIDSSMSKIWICGVGATLNGLNDYLYKDYQCPAEVFGPMETNKGKVKPAMVKAYGLALMGLEKGDISISLCPADIQWVNRRKKNFNYLVAASFLLLASIFSYLVSQYIHLSLIKSGNRSVIAQLSKCNALIPQLDNTLDTILHHQKMMIPFVVKGNSANRFISACKEISKVTARDHFFIYIGDDMTFKEGSSKASSQASVGGLNSSFFNSDSGVNLDSGWETNSSDFMLVEKMQEVDTIVLVGYTLCETNNEHYETLRNIQETLTESYIFKDIDIISEEELSGRNDIFGIWKKDVVNNRMLKRYLERKRFRAFAMRMPFAKKNVKDTGK